MTSGWLTLSRADVPPGDAWLGERERATLAALRVPKRRADWRLGRWTAKAALAAWLGRDGVEIAVLAAAGGAPGAGLGGAVGPRPPGGRAGGVAGRRPAAGLNLDQPPRRARPGRRRLRPDRRRLRP